MIDLHGKTILLTGASSGIGAATAAVLGEAGAAVVGHHLGPSDRTGAENALASVAADRKHFVAADFADNAGVDRLWAEAVAWRGEVDVVVLNAAKLLWGGIDDDDETWDRSWSAQLQVNVTAPARLMRHAVRFWRGRGSGGVLITLSSWNAQRGSTNPAQIAYAASKAAIKAAAQTVARGYAREGILSYVITPGIVRTRMSEEFAALQPGGEAAVTASLAMGEWVPPREIGHTVAFLASGLARHLTGATLDMNGATYVR
ncbi:MAG: SDR family oxidoreductase [Hyphomicrobiales bacterium]|nr:SDR family oxidoreductase [Hyphomicrobiales bacterium]